MIPHFDFYKMQSGMIYTVLVCGISFHHFAELIHQLQQCNYIDMAFVQILSISVTSR